MRNLITRITLARKIRRTEADIRRTHAEADRCPERAAYYLGEVAPALSIELCNLREEQRRTQRTYPAPGRMPILANMPVLGQAFRSAA